MASTRASIIGKFAYSVLFVVVLPFVLVFWARMTDASISLNAFGSRVGGIAVTSVGAVVMISGMRALIVYGKGLPMNPYPPIRFVTRGIYRITAHPIYAGFCLICIGTALGMSSSSGLWLVSPIVILSCVALVQGFEKQDLQRRFDNAQLRPLLSLPEDEKSSPSTADRISVYLLVVVPWILLYEVVRFIGIPRDAVVAYFSFETHLPVYEWTEIIYASTYFFVLLAPLVAKTRHDLREASLAGLVGTGIIIFLFLVIPLVAPPRLFISHGFFGDLLMRERSFDTPAAAFPSFHVFWAFLAASVYAARFRSIKIVWWGWAILISISCITTGMHAIVDVLAGFLVFVLVTFRRNVWEQIRGLTERIANSWKEWRLGPIRIINHGLYAGISAIVGILILCTFAGRDYLIAITVIGLSSLIGAAIWAQLVEGSPSLLRPYGWYGGLLGAVLGMLLMRFFGFNVWLMLGAGSIAAPWIQSIGRLRCLVQGCCHGREAPPSIGIRHIHSMSRVCRLTSLTGVGLHPTQLYSILANVVIGIVLARLWLLHSSLSLIVGIYLVLAGLARFVEENYRGEPQTPVRAGLRIYQWMAMASVLVGILVTMISNSPVAPKPQFSWLAIIAFLGFGLCAWFALGVDFPNSKRRFARLA